MGLDEKNESILNLDRQLREKSQRIEQVEQNFEFYYSQLFYLASNGSSTNCTSNGKSTNNIK
jgi:hypothetical protein